VALQQALGVLRDRGKLKDLPLRDSVAAVRAGVAGGEPLLDLCYAEDSAAEVDMNVVMTGAGLLVEAQATAEGAPFSRAELDRMIDLAALGIRALTAAQTRATLAARPPVARAVP
jgi:ribonuclease PH